MADARTAGVIRVHGGPEMLKRFGRLVLEGLAAILPLAVTLYALWWLGAKAESALGAPIRWTLRQLAERLDSPGIARWYVPGMGVVAGFVLLLAVGILARLWITRRLLALGERIMARIPLAKTIYGSVKDLLSVFAGHKKSFSTVAFVTLPGTPFKVLGLVTREDFHDMPQVGDDRVSVYFPMSYQIGGYTMLVPKETIEKVDMTIEEAMRFAMTAGVSVQERSPAARAAGAETPGNRQAEPITDEGDKTDV